jgi:hypothetical protein
MRTRLTDVQIWLILNTPLASDEQLAATIGAKVSTVHNARWKLSRAGWSCSVRYAACRYCGELAALRGSSLKHSYHVHCRPLALTEIQRRLDADRPVPAEKIARIQQWGDATQQRTRRDATNAGIRWTDDDDAVVLDLMGRPIVETCEELRRSMAAVSHRRVRLRRLLADNRAARH